MGTRLRKLKSKKQKLSDGKSVSGRGRLTFSAYYGLAITRNVKKTVSEMRSAIWAEYLHLMSSNNNPCHTFCPTDDDTWCKYQQAMKDRKEYDHEKHFHLPSTVKKFIKPVFADLSDPLLLKKCLKGKTQNVNESLNNIIWTRIPKNVFVTLDTLRLEV